MTTFSIEGSGITNNNIIKIVINLNIYFFFHQMLFKELKPTDLLCHSLHSTKRHIEFMSVKLGLYFMFIVYHTESFKRTYDRRHVFRCFFIMYSHKTFEIAFNASFDLMRMISEIHY